MIEKQVTGGLSVVPDVERGPFRPRTNAALALATGRVFRGNGFGATGSADGEAVFTTTMTGYQEVCTDPSFRRQLVCMTYPLIGNYGVNADDDESRQPWIAGLVVRERCDDPSNWRSIGTIDDYLKKHGIPAISGVDTRALTRHIRSVGDTRAVLVHNAADISDAELIERATKATLPGELDVVDEVAADEIETLGDPNGPHVIVIDCGVKRNIVRSLTKRGAKVTVVPYGTPYTDIVALNPDGVILSPGPGDPANLDEGLDVVRDVLRDGVPYFGICLGHQLLARAIGADTGKLKFGHRGGNHPVLDLRTGHVSITSQNHGFRVLEDTLPKSDEDWRVALVNLNDRSVEGLAHRTQPVISVQFHPEASPGPLDNGYLFDEFLEMIAARSASAATRGS
jgi:carbamoyl-phosphate synthase small subunit